MNSVETQIGLEKIGMVDLTCRLYNKVKQLTGKSKTYNKNYEVKNQAGELVMKPNEIVKVRNMILRHCTIKTKSQRQML